MARTLTIRISSLDEGLKRFRETYKAVEDDLRILADYGLVRMSRGRAIGKRRVKIPQAVFGEIALRIAI